MLLDDIRQICLRHSQRAAVIGEDGSITFGELWETARRIAARLLRDEYGAPVAVYGHKGRLLPACFLGCLLSGRAYLPCDPVLPPDRIREMCRLAGTSLIIAPQQAYPSPVEAFPVIDSRELQQLPPAAVLKLPPADSKRTAYLIFTSGSAGLPKGVEVTVGNVQNFIRWLSSLPAVQNIAAGTICNQALFSFDLSVAELYLCLAGGHTLLLTTRQEQSALPQDSGLLLRMARQRCRMLVCTPTFLALCLLHPDFCHTRLPLLQTILLCGEPLPVRTAQRLRERFPAMRILNLYGPTEATCAVAGVELTPRLLSLPLLPVGEVSGAAVDIHIVDRALSPLPDGSEGEILLAGKSVAQGYLGEKQGGFCSFQGKRAYRTGDTGIIYTDSQGKRLLCCHGRLDRQLKWKGFRIEPGEIEAALETVEGISQAAVLPVRAQDGRVLRLAAFVAGSAVPAFETLRQQLGSRLPAYMIPTVFHRLQRLPLNANGKRDLQALENILRSNQSL